jgi:hypothetical protein
MVSNCANPKCQASFKYFGTGQLFISKIPASFSDSLQQELQWLCDDCADSFLFVDELRPVSPATHNSTKQSSSLPDSIGDNNVLLDCANSACAAIFISPSQGKLFKFNGFKPSSPSADRFAGGTQNGSDQKEAWFWLCDDCSRHMTVRMVRGHAEVVPVRHSMAA